MKPRKKQQSLMKRLLIPMTVVMLVQELVFVSSILWGSTLERLNQNAMEMLEERTLSVQGHLQNEMIQRWSNIDGNMNIINGKILDMLDATSASSSDLTTNSALSARMLNEVSDELVKLLQYSTFSAVFLIFNGDAPAKGPAENNTPKTGLYLWDSNPLSTPGDNSDLLIQLGPVELVRRLSIPMDVGWEPALFPDEADDFFYEPLTMAWEYPDYEESSLGYWSEPFCLSETNGTKMLTYSVSLRDRAGVPYAVMGIGLETEYLQKSVMGPNQSARQKEVYLLAKGQETESGEMEFRTLLIAGSRYSRMFEEGDILTAEKEPSYSKVFPMRIGDEAEAVLYGSVEPLDMYDNQLAFRHENWYLIGVEEKSALFGFSNEILRRLVFFWAFCLLLGIVCLFVVGRHLVRPITRLSESLWESDPRRPVKLKKINIREIDQLSGAVEQMSQSVAENASKLSQIIAMTDVILGAYEYKNGSDIVFCTEGFFRGFGIEDAGSTDLYMQKSKFKKKMEELLRFKESGEPEKGMIVFRLHTDAGTLKWVQLKYVESENLSLGVTRDVTAEMIEKKKLEYERDYDPLTNLLNRRSFRRLAEERLADTEHVSNGFLLMMDLDNLKYVNDTYGHDCGDQYIRGAAIVLDSVAREGVLAARVSGDEFYLLVTGKKSREELRRELIGMQRQFASAAILLPDGQKFRVRASAGIAWYPDDSENLDELIRFADFAMYEVKRSDKGALREFSRKAYERDSILLYGKDMLNKLIDSQLVKYAFQPIVEVSTGKVHGYELLMRPQLEGLENPLDVLRLARSQSRLYDIERMTWFCAMETVKAHASEMKNYYHFINSISNQALTDEDLEEFDRRFGDLLANTVIELTEDEQNSRECTLQKQERCRLHNQRIALDDFGSGHNGDVILLETAPNYVKLDVEMIRGIDRDRSRQQLVQKLLDYLKQQSISIIAEGVETREEMEWLACCGVEYMQGYYFGRPSFEVRQPSPEACAALAEVRERIARGL